MPLKAKYATEAEIPEPLRAEYKQVGSVWLLQIEGGAPEGFIERAKFEAADTQLRAAKTKLDSFGDLNADQVRADLAELGSFRQSFGAGSTEDAKKAVETQAKAIAAAEIQKKDNELKAAVTRAESAEKHASSLVIDNDLQAKAAAAGVLPEALPDVVRLGRDVFRYRDGKAVGYDGENPKLNGAGQPYGVEDFVSDLKVGKKYFFPPSSGGGSAQTGNRGSGNGDSVPRNADGSVNLTALHELRTTNPAVYQQVIATGEHLKVVTPEKKAA